MVDQRSWVHVLSVISRGCVWEIDVWVLPALLRRLKGWGSACQCSDHTPYTASNWSASLSSQKEASSKDDAQESRKQFAEDKQTKDMDYWNHVLWSDETKINLFGSDGVKCVWRQLGKEYKDKCISPVKHGGRSVMFWGCMSAMALGSYSSLREPWMPTCTVTHWNRAWSPPFGDWPAGQNSNMITTTALLKNLRVKVMDWCFSMVSVFKTDVRQVWCNQQEEVSIKGPYTILNQNIQLFIVDTQLISIILMMIIGKCIKE